MNLILNVMVAAFRCVALWAARHHPENPSSTEVETVVGDIVYGLLITRTFKRIWRLAGRPDLLIQITPCHIIGIRRSDVR